MFSLLYGFAISLFSQFKEDSNKYNVKLTYQLVKREWYYRSQAIPILIDYIMKKIIQLVHYCYSGSSTSELLVEAINEAAKQLGNDGVIIDSTGTGINYIPTDINIISDANNTTIEEETITYNPYGNNYTTKVVTNTVVNNKGETVDPAPKVVTTTSNKVTIGSNITGLDPKTESELTFALEYYLKDSSDDVRKNILAICAKPEYIKEIENKQQYYSSIKNNVNNQNLDNPYNSLDMTKINIPLFMRYTTEIAYLSGEKIKITDNAYLSLRFS
jgi:hypothetical protein